MPSHETLPEDHVLKLKPILEREYGREFSDEEVERIAGGLVRLYTLLADNGLGIGNLEESEATGSPDEHIT